MHQLTVQSISVTKGWYTLKSYSIKYTLKFMYIPGGLRSVCNELLIPLQLTALTEIITIITKL